MAGFVSLIGAGPGDLGLLTLKAKFALERADVVLYDHLANPEILRFCAHAEHIFVGKKGFSEYMSQQEISLLMVEKALQDKRVIRLKGGDVFVFGRGGEEAEACIAAGVPFEVIPGITSAIAVPAYAGIPVTHREAGSSFAVLTGNEMLRDAEKLKYQAFNDIDTLIFLMGVKTLPRIVERLLEIGKSKDTPAATIQWGTTQQQKVVEGTLENIVQKVQEAGIGAPAVTVVGEVVRYRNTLKWFDSRPLWGRKVAVTRTREGGSELGNLLRQEGAIVIEVPLIRFEQTSEPEALQEALRHISRFEWVLFTSQQGIQAAMKALDELGLDARAFAGVKLAVVGPSTARELARYGLRADFMPSRAGGVHLGNEVPASGQQPLLHFASSIAEADLHEALTHRGMEVHTVEAYQTLPSELSEEQRERLKDAEVITLASGSAARACASQLGTDIPAVTMGPQTHKAALAAGFSVAKMAETPSLLSLVGAVKAALLES
ncbi:uroporphyrinogen-III C-methyltransferase [Deinococcus roseus]|uniref:uroporphyrinogen-III C-methyltransferase n=1 Tax=Deinococcus roseus TaxID=392414 RepID=A0ABQ2DKL6_9DEIO|nr:uroporphyrinogen-III C-methyltransferase [Deinococcus roseus]GGJ58826.1 uroporphyrinogen-III C-methyltransferase [Deinococcus roseus]